MSKTNILLALTLLMASAVIAVTVMLYFIRQSPIPIVIHPEPSLQELYPIAEFQFTDSTNADFGLDDLHDTTWVADFIFTTCDSICPTLSANMATLHKQFADMPDVQFVSITVDPETDTPEVLAEYAGRFSADPARWHFLTGPLEDIHTLAAESFKVGSVDNPVFHSNKFILVDNKGYVRGYYTGTDPDDVQRLATDIEALRAEPGDGAIALQGTEPAIKVFD